MSAECYDELYAHDEVIVRAGIVLKIWMLPVKFIGSVTSTFNCNSASGCLPFTYSLLLNLVLSIIIMQK